MTSNARSATTSSTCTSGNRFEVLGDHVGEEHLREQ